MKEKAFFIIFQRLSTAKNGLRPKSAPLNKFKYLVNQFLNQFNLIEHPQSFFLFF